MRFLISAISIAVMVVACGGGGGSGGTPVGGGSTGGGTSGTGGGATDSEKKDLISVTLFTGDTSAPVSTASISASERTARVQIKLTDSSGNPKAGQIVSFSENGPGLLVFNPVAATALTDSNGVAEIEVAALSSTSLGATTISVTSGDVTASKNISISSAVTEGVDPQAAVQSVGFTSVVPSDKSIVIAGAGGTGRSETAILQFNVKDKSGNPVKDAVVDFEVVPSGVVQLNIASAKSNNDGLVATSVSSKSTATAVIVKAVVRGKSISTQSDTLTVSNGISTQRGFDISASKYNLNLDLSGDSSTIRIAIVDSSGNPVADGVPILAIADFGRIASSDRGGCTTQNGVCSVEYQVQNPRPDDGVPVSLTFSTQTGNNDVISDTLNLWVTSIGWGDFYSSQSGGVPVTAMTLSGADPKCKFSWDGFLGTPNGFPMPANTSISVKSKGSVVQGTMDTVLDKSSTRNIASISFTLKDALVAGSEQVEFTLTQGATVKKIIKTVNYPRCIEQ